MVVLLFGGWYGGLVGVIGMIILDLFDLVYMVGVLKIFILKLCIGLIIGLIVYKYVKID